MTKYKRGTSDEILEETYQYAKSVTEETPTPSLGITKAALEILYHEYPKAKETDPNLLIEMPLMKNTEQSGSSGRSIRDDERPRACVGQILPLRIAEAIKKMDWAGIVAEKFEVTQRRRTRHPESTV